MEGTDDIPIQPKPTGEQYTPHEQTVSTLCKRDPKPAPDITQPDVLDTFIDHLVEEARLEVIYPNAIAVIDLLFLHIFASIRISEVLQPGLLPILFRETRRPLEDIWQRVADGLISSLFDEEPTYSEPPAYMTLAFYGNPTGETFDVKTFTVPAADGTVDTPTPISMEAVVGAEAPSNADDEEEEWQQCVMAETRAAQLACYASNQNLDFQKINAKPSFWNRIKKSVSKCFRHDTALAHPDFADMVERQDAQWVGQSPRRRHKIRQRLVNSPQAVWVSRQQ